MSTLVGPLAVGVVGIGLILLIVVTLAGLVYELITRGNPRQVEVDEEREQVAEQIGAQRADRLPVGHAAAA